MIASASVTSFVYALHAALSDEMSGHPLQVLINSVEHHDTLERLQVRPTKRHALPSVQRDIGCQRGVAVDRSSCSWTKGSRLWQSLCIIFQPRGFQGLVPLCIHGGHRFQEIPAIALSRSESEVA